MADLGPLLTSHVSSLLLMVSGFVLIVIEMYIPGFGLPGISGIILYTIGLILLGPTPLQALFLVVITLVLLGIALALAMRSIRKGRLNKTNLVLHDAVTEATTAEDEPQLPKPGEEGTSHTALRPSGIVYFGDKKINAQSEGDFIAAGKRVVAVKAKGKRMIVREISDNV